MFLALDLASRLSGWCAGTGAAIPECGAWEFEAVNGDYGLLLTTLEDYLDVTWMRFHPTAVAYEKPILVAKQGKNRYGDKLSTLRLLYPMGAFVEWWARRRDIPCYEIDLHDVKRELTGNARADKADMVRVARHVGLRLPTGRGEEDAADAFGVWLSLLRSHNRAAAERFDKAIYGRTRLL